MEFEWDPDKESFNLKKHQVGFAEAKMVLAIRQSSPFKTRLIRSMKPVLEFG